MKTLIKIIATANILLVLQACDPTGNPFVPSSETHSSGKTTIYIEDSYQPLFTTSLSVFGSQNPNAHIKPIYCSEYDVIHAFLTKKTKSIFISRDFTKIEKAKLKASQIEVRSDKLAEDAVALIVHPTNQDSTMSIEKLKNILLGKDSIWPTSKTKINVVFDNENSANFNYLMKLVNNANISANVFAVKSNEEVINYVKNHPESIGVIGVNWISDKDDSEALDFLNGIVVVGLSKKNGGECFKPYQAYIFDKSYPLTRELWSINFSSKQGLASGFIYFLTDLKGQMIIKKSSLVPANSPIRLIQINTK